MYQSLHLFHFLPLMSLCSCLILFGSINCTGTNRLSPVVKELSRSSTSPQPIMFKLLICALLAGVVAAYYGAGPSRYSFEYAVHDPRTQDIKNQWEARDGTNVRGSYSLVEADGSRRVVDYTADGHNGFNAIVRRQGLHHGHPQVSYHGHGHNGFYYRR